MSNDTIPPEVVARWRQLLNKLKDDPSRGGEIGSILGAEVAEHFPALLSAAERVNELETERNEFQLARHRDTAQILERDVRIAELERRNSDLTALLDEGLQHDRMVSIEGRCYSGCPKCQWERMKGCAK